MKNILSLISISSLLLVLAACGSKQAPTAEEIVAKARAVKTLNAYDEMSCVVYEMKGLPESPQTSIDRFISDDCVEGTGSFELILFLRQCVRNRIRIYPAEWGRLSQ